MPVATAEPASSASASRFELSDVAFTVDGRALLSPLTLTLEAGRVIGLVGHNGSGKSTLIKLLARQQPSSGGTIRFEGEALDTWRSKAFARRVGYLPQTPAAATGLLVRELVALGRYPWHGALGRFGEADRQAVAEAMRLTDTDVFADRMVEELSGGERQRVWLAMLVAQGTQWLLLDEPTSALDVAHQIEVLALVRRLSRSHGLGVVIVLHDVNMAARFCDEFVALHTGKMIARGAPADLMTAEQLEAIFGAPMDVLSGPDGTLFAAPRIEIAA